eukprot:gb/GFBE01003161.1/.p1 GENE.gb/GFBE01003161.1/~~gb/GFBE01003161.1/.p1  ORF type:complete len:440 (+),score=92.66 gb/GFBE01003161.1/:1-1320(+)
MPAARRWGRKTSDAETSPSAASTASSETPCPPPPAVPSEMKDAYQSRAKSASHILQHYHATGCAGGAFSWRAALLDPNKGLVLCTEPREYRETTLADIQYSKDDKRRGGGPRVGPFQECIPGESWWALPKYDLETRRRSSAFNERMHVEWENHVDHILANGGKLPTASVVAKAGFRSCSPCCRDMLALARPTGKTFIMVDLAEDDQRGTFHFVTGDKYLPVPKEALEPAQVSALKGIVSLAQDNMYPSSQDIYDAVVALGVPIDEQAQRMYLGDSALMPAGSGAHLQGANLLQVLHAEHFARLTAEYGASILRDPERPKKEIAAVLECRDRARQLLMDAWRPNLAGAALQRLSMYADAAVTPLLPENIREYLPLKSATVSAMKAARRAPRLTAAKLQDIGDGKALGKASDSDVLSVADASTAVPDEDFSDSGDLEDGGF